MDKKEEKKVTTTEKVVEKNKDNKTNADVKNKRKEEHVKAHTSRKSSKYKEMVKGYKRRNRIVEIVIACVVLVAAFILCCNYTFLKTNFTKEVNSSVISIDLPRFTYYIDSDEDTIIFKTLRKSENTRSFFEDFLKNERFDIYYCGDKEYYYDSEGKFFITDIKVEKTFAIKTITINYSTEDYNLICDV